MPPPRKWDHDEGLRLYAEGMSIPAIAKIMGVTDAPVRVVCDPAYRKACREANRRSSKSVECVDCGKTIWKRAHNAWRRCRSCAAIAVTTNVRPDTLLCTECREWKPDAMFPKARNKPGRRGRHALCRGCQAVARRRSRHSRRVPCAKCGQPKSHPDDTRVDSGLCLHCYRVAMRKAA